MTPHAPPLVLNPAALSPEHHLLRRLNDTQPVDLPGTVAAVVRQFPAYTGLGTREQPSAAAYRGWEAISREPWTRAVQRRGGHGLVLTGHGELRLRDLWHREVISPYLRQVEQDYGRAVAQQVAAELTRELG